MSSGPCISLFILSHIIFSAICHLCSFHLCLSLLPGSLFCSGWRVSLCLHQCLGSGAAISLTVSFIGVFAFLGPLLFCIRIRISFVSPQKNLLWIDGLFENWYIYDIGSSYPCQWYISVILFSLDILLLKILNVFRFSLMTFSIIF